jgi:hypothetical protein
MVYIQEPLLMHRIHSQNDSFQAADNLMEVIGPYVLHYQFAETARSYNLKKVAERLPKSLEKLGKQCLRYCIRALTKNDETNARRYFYLSMVVTDSIKKDDTFEILQEYWSLDAFQKSQILKSLQATDNLVTRSVSYDPPPGSIALEDIYEYSEVA